MEEEESEDGRGVLEGSRTEAGSLESLLGVAPSRQQRRRKPEIATVGEVVNRSNGLTGGPSVSRQLN